VPNGPASVQESPEHPQASKSDLRPVDECLDASALFKEGSHCTLTSFLTAEIALMGTELREGSFQHLVVGAQELR
jgi:hypothetical protein